MSVRSGVKYLLRVTASVDVYQVVFMVADLMSSSCHAQIHVTKDTDAIRLAVVLLSWRCDGINYLAQILTFRSAPDTQPALNWDLGLCRVTLDEDRQALPSFIVVLNSSL